MPDSAVGWLSLHLDLAHQGSGWAEVYGSEADQVLLEVVAPAVGDLADELSGFFFIRYRDPQGHVRLRLRLHPDRHENAREVVSGAVAAYNRTTRLTRVARVRKEVYQPEVARYGGTIGVGISEGVFEASSVLVLDTLRLMAASHDRMALRIGHAAAGLLIHAACLTTEAGATPLLRTLERYEHTHLRSRMDSTDAAEVGERYGRLAQGESGLLDQLRLIGSVASQPDALPEPLSPAAARLVRARDELQCASAHGRISFGDGTASPPSFALPRLASSYIHMHLNRLGVPPVVEVLACRLVATALVRETPSGAIA